MMLYFWQLVPVFRQQFLWDVSLQMKRWRYLAPQDIIKLLFSNNKQNLQWQWYRKKSIKFTTSFKIMIIIYKIRHKLWRTLIIFIFSPVRVTSLPYSPFTCMVIVLVTTFSACTTFWLNYYGWPLSSLIPFLPCLFSFFFFSNQLFFCWEESLSGKNNDFLIEFKFIFMRINFDWTFSIDCFFFTLDI